MNIFFQKNILISLAIVVFSLFTSSYIAFAQSPDYISQWSGDTVSGTMALDEGIGNNGTLLGGVSVVSAKAHDAFKFDGSSGYIKMGNPATLNFGTGPFSLEAWFMWNGGGGSSASNIIRKSNYPVEGNGAGYWLRTGNTPENKQVLEFFTGETVGNVGQSRGKITIPITPKIWHHAVGTRNSSGTMKLYVDGELKGTTEAPGAQTTSAALFTLGAWDDRFGVKEFFSGMIGEVSIYNTVLSESEIKSAYVEFSQYPIQELGNCRNQKECRAYCDDEDNFDACFDYGIKAGLIDVSDNPFLAALQKGEGPGGCKNGDSCGEYCKTADHIKECVVFLEKFDLLPSDVLQKLHDIIVTCEREQNFNKCIESSKIEDAPAIPDVKQIAETSKAAKDVHEAIQKGEGPGKCKDEVACRSYCEDMNHISECLVFVEKFNLVSPDELKEMRQIVAAKQSGVDFPGNCKTKESCLKYCEVPSRAVECVNFAEAAGFITGDEAAQAKKFAPLIARGETPGGCSKKEQCEAYCEEGAHIDECLDFAIKHNLFPPDELEIMKKIQPFVKAGKMPGGCKGKTECEAYCEDAAHSVECIDIGLALGMIKPEEVEIIKKSGGHGPGNCRSSASCEAFCTKPEHQKECMDFAVKVGLMTQEEAEQAQSAGDMKECFEEADDKITACFITNLGTDVFEQMKAGHMPYDIAIVEKVRKAKACVDQYTNRATDQLEKLLKALPAANSCLEADLGADFMIRLRKGIIPCSQMKGMKGKMETCFQKGTNSLFEVCAAKDCSEVQSCMMNVGKSLTIIVGQPEGGDHPDQKQELPKAVQDKLNSCGININFDTKTCLDKPTCKEFVSCLDPGENKSLPHNEGESFEMPPERKTRMDSCQKEIIEMRMRECTDKQTCAEVNTCLAAQQSQGSQNGGKQTGQQFEFPADIKSRLNTCQQEEVQQKIDKCLVLSCSEFDGCIKALQQSGGEQQEQKEQNQPNPKMMAKVQACQNEKMDVCLVKSCSEFDACVASLQQSSGGQGQQQQGQGTPDPKMMAKVQVCQNEKINACLSKPCTEFFTCLNSLSSGGGGGSGGGQQQQGSNPAIEAKVQSCIPKGPPQ